MTQTWKGVELNKLIVTPHRTMKAVGITGIGMRQIHPEFKNMHVSALSKTASFTIAKVNTTLV